MSAAPFNPLPDQLQQDSGSPAVDVMRPADQPADQPAPAATPNYPPSPDQGGPVPQSSPDPDAGSSTHGWRAVLRGALSGLESHLKGAGEGMLTGGIAGAVTGAIAPSVADTAFKNARAMAQARVQTAQAHARSAIEDANFAPQNNDLQLAITKIHQQQLEATYDTMPKDFQDRLSQEAAEAGQHLIDSGVPVVYSGTEADAKAHVQALMSVNADKPLNVLSLPDAREISMFSKPRIPIKAMITPSLLPLAMTPAGSRSQRLMRPARFQLHAVSLSNLPRWWITRRPQRRSRSRIRPA